jgi:predicted Zn-dependent protease
MARVAAGLILIAALLPGCATLRPPASAWDVSDYRGQSALNLRRGSDGSVVAQLAAGELKRVFEVKQRVEKAAALPAPARLVLTDAEQPNAFATQRGGQTVVGITLSMLRLLGADSDALAHLLGHELAHHTRKHGETRKDREQTRRGVSQVLGTILNVAGVPLGGTLAGLGTSAVANVYTRDEEREADELGFRYAVAAGFDREGGVRLFERLSASGSTAPLAFFSSHPASAERIENMRRLAAQRTP